MFTKLETYKTHVFRHHRTYYCNTHADLSAGTIADSVNYDILCPICNDKIKDLIKLSSHFARHCQSGLVVKCVISGCSASFRLHSSYSSHMSRCHKDFRVVNDLYCHYHTVRDIADEINSVDDSGEDNQTDEAGILLDCSAIQKTLAMHFMKMQESVMIPVSTVQLAVENCVAFYEINQDITKSLIQNILLKHDVSVNIQNEITTALANSPFGIALMSLDSDSKRKTYISNYCGLVAPKALYYRLNAIQSAKCFQYISLIESLKSLLRNEDILCQVMATTTAKPNIISSYADSTSFRSNPIFRNHQNSLQIILYSDEFEVVNPIGAHKKKHKILAFYYILGNLNCNSRSKKSDMQLLCLCKSKHITKFGLQFVAQCVNEELTVLENEGIDIGQPEKLYGALAMIVGDNLNSHMIGGFNCSFSPNVFRPCRFCMVTRDEIKTVLEVDKFTSRTEESYKHQAMVVAQDPSQAQTFGVRNNSPFNHGSFHVSRGLPPDIMHDILEGVAPYEMALVLRSLIGQGYFTVEKLNKVIKRWPFGPLDRLDRPVEIATDFGDKIQQNAGRTWCLLRMLPLMIGEWIPENNVYHQFLCDLVDIVEMAFSFSLSTPLISLLQTKIQDHLQEFLVLFPNKSLLPKHHFLLHYGHAYTYFGPLHVCWSMHFESKHAYFKKLVRVINNFKNLLSTLAERHQLYQAYLTHVDFKRSDVSKISKTTEIIVENFSEELKHMLTDSGIQLERPIHDCHFISYCGIDYHIGMYVVIGYNEIGPIFGKIVSIYMQDMVHILVLRICCSEWEEHFHAYRIALTGQFKLLSISELVDYYPLSSYERMGRKYVVTKNFLFDEHDYADLR